MDVQIYLSYCPKYDVECILFLMEYFHFVFELLIDLWVTRRLMLAELLTFRHKKESPSDGEHTDVRNFVTEK